MPELAQDVVVTLAALWAVWVIARRLFSTIGPGGRRTASCDHCPTGQTRQAPADAPKPLALIRERRS